MINLFNTNWSWTQIIITFFVIYILNRFLVLLTAYQKYPNMPRKFLFLNPMSPLSGLQQAFTGKSPMRFIWTERETWYENVKSEIILVLPLLNGEATVWTCSNELVRHMISNTSEFVKPAMATEVVGFMGDNVVSTQHEDWKRHRRITAPAFSNATYKNVWNTTINVYNEIVSTEGWNRNLKQDGEKSESSEYKVQVSQINDKTRKLAMFIVAGCSFGVPMSWNGPSFDKNGEWTLEHVITKVSDFILIRALIKPSLLYLPIPILQEVKQAYDKFTQYASKLVSDRETQMLEDESGQVDPEQIKDILGRLVNAKIAEGSKLSLSAEEIIGNCFILLFAGHETTAHTLCATLALLGFYPDVQEEVYQTIRSVCADRDPTLDDYDKLDIVLGCFYEALRLYPPAFVMNRTPAANTYVSLPNFSNPSQTDNVLLHKGTTMVVDMIRVCHNPRIFSSPESFIPSRWTGPTAPLDHIGFSTGPRVCLGKKFASVEAVAFLSCFLRDWKVSVPRPEGGGGMEEMLEPTFGFTLQMGKIPLELVARSK